MQAPIRPICQHESHWRLKDAARRRAHELRNEAIDAFCARITAALRRWPAPHRSRPPGRVALCD